MWNLEFQGQSKPKVTGILNKVDILAWMGKESLDLSQVPNHGSNEMSVNIP